MKNVIIFLAITFLFLMFVVSCSSGGSSDGDASQNTQLTGTVEVVGGSNQQ